MDEALAAAQEAEKIARNLYKQDSENGSARNSLAVSLSNQSTLLGMSGELKPAMVKANEAIEHFMSLVDVRQHHTCISAWHSPRTRLAIYSQETQLSHRTQRWLTINQPMPFYLSALGHVENAIEMNPKDSQFLSWRVKLLSNLAIWNGSVPAGMRFAKDALKAARELQAEYPDDLDTRESLAVALTNEGIILLEGPEPRPKESVAPLKESLELYVGLSTQVPKHTEFTWGVAMSNSNFGAAWPQTL